MLSQPPQRARARNLPKLALLLLACGSSATSPTPAATFTGTFVLDQVNASPLPYTYIQGSSSMTTFSARYQFQGAEAVHQDSVTYFAPSLGPQNFSKTCRYTMAVTATRIELFPAVTGCGVYTELARTDTELVRTADHQEYRYRQR